MHMFNPFPSEQILLEVKNVSKTFSSSNNNGASFVTKFNLEINANEIMCLLGCNGSGKTTIINMLTGLTQMDNDDGDVLIHMDNGRKTVSLRSNPFEFKSYIRLC